MVTYDADVVDTMDGRVDGNFAGCVCDYPAIPYGVPRGIDNEFVKEVVGDSDYEVFGLLGESLP